jgi:alpha-tubulin suppressor-like RCC1 family protein
MTSGGINWKEVVCGGSHTAAIKTDGTLWLWGTNTNGRLGDNTTVAKSSPIQTVAAGTNWNQVSIRNHNAAIKTDGTLWLWGGNINGRLGDNTIVSKSSPVQTVAGGTNWKQVSCGFDHTSAIKTDGTLWVWGDNQYGQLGTNNLTNYSSPVQTISGGTNWKQVSQGGFSTAAIKTDGTLWVWGSNGSGQLGTNDRTNRSSPVQTISAGNNWKTVGRSIAIRDDSLDPL